VRLVPVLQDKKKHKEVESTFWGVVLMLGYLGYVESSFGFKYSGALRPGSFPTSDALT